MFRHLRNSSLGSTERQQCQRGVFDKVCYSTFVMGGFSEQYKTMGAMIEAQKDNHCLVGEFAACRSVVIDLALEGDPLR